MNEKQRILVDGKHWEGIVRLPCFRELTHWNHWSVLVVADYVNGEEVGYEDEWYGTAAHVGDTIVEYADGLWGVIRGKEAHDE